MSNLILIFLCLLLGFVFQKISFFPKDTHKGINAYIIWVALPALALLYIPKLEFSKQLLGIALMPWAVFGVSILFFKAINYFFKWNRATEGCLVLSCGLCNTSFVGFPLLEFLYGSKEPLQYAIVIDQAGSFLVVATVGVLVAMSYGGEAPRARVIMKKLFYFPPFLAFLVALILLPFGGLDSVLGEVGIILEQMLEKLAQPLIVLALFSVGLQIQVSKDNLKFLNPLFWGLIYKLLLAPLFMLGIYLLFFTELTAPLKIGILEAAMPPMVTGVLLAQEYDLNPSLGSFLLAIGIPTSIGSVYWWFGVL